jgi:MFS family permease
MNASRLLPRTLVAALIGLASLASAMGVGRFAFTPLLPLMQANGSVDLAQGVTLAFANYVGYFVWALLCGALAPAPHRAARLGLVAVAVLTLAMGVTNEMTAWIALRFGAGVASACVLVGVSAWALAVLAGGGRPDQAGWVYSGVGVGIAAAGIVGLVAAVWKLIRRRRACLVRQARSLSWRGRRCARRRPAPGVAEAAPSRGASCCVFHLRLRLYHPATFLPAMAAHE